MTRPAPHIRISTVPDVKPFVLASFAKSFLIGIFASGLIIYALFQKKLLPKAISKVVAKVLFYPTYPITTLIRLGNFWTDVDETVILGCAPMSIFEHPQQLYRLGVRGVVNLCDEYKGPTWAYSELGIKQLYLPTIDHCEPSLEYMTEAVEFIKRYKARGEKVYVHCKAGHGRGMNNANTAYTYDFNRCSRIYTKMLHHIHVCTGAAVALCWLISQNPSMTAQVHTYSSALA